MKSALKSNIKRISLVALSLVIFLSFTIGVSYAATTVNTTLSQTINSASIGISIVDAAGDPVGSPSVSFGAFAFSFTAGNSAGILGTSSQKIRVSNPTAADTWTVSIAATGGESSVWTDGGTNTYPYNHISNADLGRLTVDATTNGVVTPAGGCSNTNVSKGASSTFVSGTTSNITILSAAEGSDPYCYWDLTAVDLTQRIPASQAPASYSLGMTLSVI